mmetsp:Transcript_13560/g.41193  ORF Transcript_13560/g.41193 Transcript_13560/m.41193 type:complete len:264 (+) Transcript_13560:1080-1871(+)
MDALTTWGALAAWGALACGATEATDHAGGNSAVVARSAPHVCTVRLPAEPRVLPPSPSGDPPPPNNSSGKAARAVGMGVCGAALAPSTAPNRPIGPATWLPLVAPPGTPITDGEERITRPPRTLPAASLPREGVVTSAPVAAMGSRESTPRRSRSPGKRLEPGLRLELEHGRDPTAAKDPSSSLSTDDETARLLMSNDGVDALLLSPSRPSGTQASPAPVLPSQPCASKPVAPALCSCTSQLKRRAAGGGRSRVGSCVERYGG